MRHKSDFPALSDAVVRIQRVAASDNESLNNLAAESPSAPNHSASFVKPRRRNASGGKTPVAPATAATSQLDLMTWMRGVHIHRGGH